MFRIKHSIGRRMMALLFAALVFTSLLLSVSFYFISVNTINNYVVPQIDKLLSAASQDVYKALNSTHAQQSRGNDQAAMNVEYYFQSKRTQHKVETIFLAEYSEGKAVVLSADHGSALKRKEQVQVTPALEQTLKGKNAISGIYTDNHGIHKTAYVAIPGSSLIIGVSSDMTFVKDKMSYILWTSAGITLLALVISMSAAWLLSRRITRPIIRLAAYSDRLAEGDFTREPEIEGHDEISRLAGSFRTMTLRLKEVIGQVLNAADTVMADSNALKERVDGIRGMAERSGESALEIGKGSTSIASSAADNARAMEEISMGVQHIAAAAGEVTEQIHEASGKAASGNDTAHSAMEQMLRIKRASGESLEQFRRMDGHSQTIGDVVQGISEIAGQIQMLSLNASIEAARAGEHGRGFAVVAGEVRKLSEQSRQATEQIREFLLNLREEMRQSVVRMNEVNAEVASGAGQVEEAGNAFNHLAVLMQSINQSVQAVSAATQQISAGTEEVAASVEETARITSKSKAGAEELADNYRSQQEQLDGHAETVEHLYRQTVNMQKAVRKFKI